MSYTQSAVRITSELSDASIKPEYEDAGALIAVGHIFRWYAYLYCAVDLIRCVAGAVL